MATHCKTIYDYNRPVTFLFAGVFENKIDKVCHCELAEKLFKRFVLNVEQTAHKTQTKAIANPIAIFPSQ